MNILVVDDDVVGRRLSRAVFEAEGLQIFEGADGVEALAVLAHDRIDVVVADILMPRMDGYRLCHEIRQNERWRAIPIIIHSATYTTTQDEKLALEMGADFFLRKPASAGQLLHAVRECLARPHPHAAPAAPPADLSLMRNYSARLVSKLEERSLELEEKRVELREANALLEWRVQRRTEELAAANEQLDTFASFVAHEVRAPLRAISGYAAELRQAANGGLPAEAARMIELIAHTAKQTEALTDALLHFCQLGARPVRRRRILLDALLREVLAGFETERQQRGVELVVQPLPEADGDPQLLEQVFQNLISNALKFTRGQPHPRIEIGALADAPGPVVFVRDNGVGFDMRYANLIFEPFQQLHRGEGFEGSGLGLSLVRNIIVRHGGSIRVEAGPDAGATFYVTLSAEPTPVHT